MDSHKICCGFLILIVISCSNVSLIRTQFLGNFNKGFSDLQKTFSDTQKKLTPTSVGGSVFGLKLGQRPSDTEVNPKDKQKYLIDVGIKTAANDKYDIKLFKDDSDKVREMAQKMQTQNMVSQPLTTFIYIYITL